MESAILHKDVLAQTVDVEPVDVAVAQYQGVHVGGSEHAPLGFGSHVADMGLVDVVHINGVTELVVGRIGSVNVEMVYRSESAVFQIDGIVAVNDLILLRCADIDVLECEIVLVAGLEKIGLLRTVSIPYEGDILHCSRGRSAIQIRADRLAGTCVVGEDGTVGCLPVFQ